MKQPRIYCDFNKRVGPSTYGLNTIGTREDLERQHLRLTEGTRVCLYDHDTFENGDPAWIAVDAVIVEDPNRGFVAVADPQTFRLEARHQTAIFEVREITELTGRGGVAAGTILEGELRRGLKARVRGDDASLVILEIRSVEFLDDRAAGKALIAILFQGAPSAELLRGLVPPGTKLEFD